MRTHAPALSFSLPLLVATAAVVHQLPPIGCARPASLLAINWSLPTLGSPAAAGFVVEISAATIVVLGSRFSLPISTTHCLVGAVSGIGAQCGPLACICAWRCRCLCRCFCVPLTHQGAACPGQDLSPRAPLSVSLPHPVLPCSAKPCRPAGGAQGLQLGPPAALLFGMGGNPGRRRADCR